MSKLKLQRSHTRWLIIFCLLVLIFSAIAQAAPSKKLIELNFKNSDIKDILIALGHQAGVSVYVAPDVTATVTLQLSNKTFTEALDIIAKIYNLSVNIKENVYYITQIDTSVLKIEYEAGLLSVEARGAKLKDLFVTITQKTKKNLVLDDQILDRGSIVLVKVPLEDGIKTLLNQFNLISETIGEVTKITRKPLLEGGGSIANINYQNGNLTLDVKNVLLHTLARAITEKTNVSIVPDLNLNPPVSIYVQNLPIGDALAALCDSNNLSLTKDGQVWRIYRNNNSFRVSYKNNALSVDADGADADQLFKEIGRQSGININLDRDLRAQITIHFKNVPLFQGITSIVDSVGWMIEKRGAGYQVMHNTNNNPNIRISYNPEDKLFDIDVQQVPLNQVISEIARKADLNYSVSGQVNWPVSIRLRQVTITVAFDFLLKGTIFSYKEMDGVYIFSDTMYPRPETSDFVDYKLYTLKYLKADQVMNTLPAIFPRQDFMLLPEKNALVVTGPPNVHALFSAYLDQIDIEGIEDRTEVIRIKHLKAEDVLKYLPATIPKNNIIVIKEMNAITVSGAQNLMSQIKQYVDKIDQPNPMIVFDIKVIKISNSNTLDWAPPTVDGLGVALSSDSPGVLPLSINGSGAIKALDALVSKGQAKVLQNPIITTLNGHPASFNVASKRTYLVPADAGSPNPSGTPIPASLKPQSVDNSLTISITPWVSANNQITMEIKPKIHEYGAIPPGLSLPDTSEHSTETVVRVSNKQTVVISGLKTTRKEKSVTKIPFLGNIPLLGFFFRKTKDVEVQDEFVVVITPSLVYDDVTRSDANQIIEGKFGTAIKNEIKSNPTPTPPPGSELTPTPTPMPGLSLELTPTPTPRLSPVLTPTPTPMTGLNSELTPTPTSRTGSLLTPTPTNRRRLAFTPTPTSRR